jgi:hypothetical protein
MVIIPDKSKYGLLLKGGAVNDVKISKVIKSAFLST